jgi:hypothetical protein
MKKLVFFMIVIGTFAGICVSQEPPKQSTATKEHELLQRLVGEWEGSAEVAIAPGQPTIKVTTNEVYSTIGSLWVVSKCNGQMGDMKMESMMTLGWDPEKKKVVGTWVDSVHNHLWIYDGSFDESGNVLTLEAKGPNMMKPGELSNYRDILTFKGDDTKVMTSQMQQEDGTWKEFMQIEYKRKK